MNWTANVDARYSLTRKNLFEGERTYSVNEELGSKRLGLFRFLETETTARGECFRGSTTRGEAGLTVLGDCLREICFDISSLDLKLREYLLPFKYCDFPDLACGSPQNIEF